MGRNRRQSPSIEPLEGKQLLSGVHYDHIVAGPPGVLVGQKPIVLNGTLRGDVSSFRDVAGPPETMTERFSGRVRTMGRVNALVVDQLDAAGNLVGGTITLTNARGSVVLGFGPNSTLSSQMAGTTTTQEVVYTVYSGSGAYANAGGAGVFTVLQDSGKSASLVLEAVNGLVALPG